MAMQMSKLGVKAPSHALNKAVLPARARRCMRIAAQLSTDAPAVSRRQLLNTAVLTSGALLLPQLPAEAAKAPAGYAVAEDLQDGYKFLYPFGWQEIAVKGEDIVFKDVIEPLESVSVTILDTDKKDITEFGEVGLVCETLAKNVLSSPGQEVKLVSTTERKDDMGHNYYEFEFTVDAKNYSRHQLSVVAVSDGRFFTLTTGASERRWAKMKDKLETTLHSFILLK